MGGIGSTRWGGYSKKATVDDGLILSAAALFRQRIIRLGQFSAGTLQWSRDGGEPFASAGFEANCVDPEAAWLRLHYRVSGEPAEQRVRLTYAVPGFGGRRWYFICPLSDPPLRVAKLYLPPGQKYFGSRVAHGLTYRSCQESKQFSGLLRRLAREGGLDDELLREFMAE